MSLTKCLPQPVCSVFLANTCNLYFQVSMILQNTGTSATRFGLFLRKCCLLIQVNILSSVLAYLTSSGNLCNIGRLTCDNYFSNLRSFSDSFYITLLSTFLAFLYIFHVKHLWVTAVGIGAINTLNIKHYAPKLVQFWNPVMGPMEH